MAVVELDLGEQIHAAALDVGRGSQITELSLAGGAQDTSLDLGEYVTALVSPSGLVLPSWLTHAWEADSLVLADGDPVASWVDSVGGAALAQTTPSLRPTYRAGGGTPYLDFDGTDDHLLFAPGGLFYRKSIFVVMRQDTFRTNGGPISENNGVPTSNLIEAYSNTGFNLVIVTNRPTVVSSLVLTSAVVYGGAAQCLTLNSGGRVYIDRVDRGAHPTQMASPGSVSRVGSGYNTGSMDGRIYALLVGPGAATLAQCTEAWDYLTAKWGTP